MKAIVVSELGGPEKLVYTEVAQPDPGDTGVVVEIAAAGVNFIDVYHRIGLYPMNLPFTPGLEGAGTVVAVGPSVVGFAPGDRVAWTQGIGSYADMAVKDPAHLVQIPGNVSLDTAAALMLQGITAHYLATSTFPLGEGDTCLIHAGAGGVGLLLTQVARILGARVVTTVGSAEKAELSRAAGATAVIEYRDVDFVAEIERLIGPRSIDVVYDGVGAATFEGGLKVLRPRGTMVTFGNASGPVSEMSPLALTQNGSLFLTRPTIGDHIATREELTSRVSDLFGWVLDGRLDVRVGSEFPLADASQAHTALESRATTGKVLLKP
ncbi:MAG: quinone oxidoreductase [Acidimicrobiia bacterium]|nr:quinone oxidoreductase [Acidimicrobiia bacterium]